MSNRSDKYKIITTNSCIIINDYDMGDSKRLEYNFRVYDHLTHTVSYLGLYHDAVNRRLYLPRGIDLWFVQQCFDEVEPCVKTHDAYDKTGAIMIKYLPRDDRQKQALRFMLSVEEYNPNRYKSQFAVNLNTGAGKTYCSVATIAYEEIRSIIITCSNSWLDQWKERILEYTDMIPDDIYRIAGAPSINTLLSGKSKNCSRKIYLVTHSTLKSYGDTYGWDKISELFRSLRIGFKFYDESHLSFANMTMVDFFTNVYKTYYVTATPARSSKDENFIYNVYMKNIPSIDLFDKDNDPRTHYVAFKYSSMPAPYEISACKNAYGLDRMKYISYLMEKPDFWRAFDIIFEKVRLRGGKALFFLGTNDAILKVRDYIVYHYPEFENDIGIYTTLSSDKNKEKEKRFILSTTKSAGAAEDIKGLKTSVVLAEPFKSEVLARQSLGRTRDEGTYYFELVDLGFKQTKQFYYAKMLVFNKYALSTKDINYTPLQLFNASESKRADRLERWKEAVSFDYDQEVISFDYDPNASIVSFMTQPTDFKLTINK